MANEFVLKRDGVAISLHPTAEAALQALNAELRYNAHYYGERHRYTIERGKPETFTEQDKDFLKQMRVSLEGDNR